MSVEVSVITPAYNSAEWILRAITSVRNQRGVEWEHIIIDDGSSDGTNSIVSEECRRDARLHLIKTERNGGAANARNLGIEAAKGRFIAFLDSDDEWSEGKLRVQRDFMLRNNLDLSCTEYYRRYANDKDKPERLVKMPSVVNYRGLLRRNFIGCLTVMLDTARLGKRYMPILENSEDYGLWLSILRDGASAGALHSPLATLYLHEGSLSSNKWRAARCVWNVLRKHEGLSFMSSVKCYCYYVLWHLREIVLNRISTLFNRL